MPWWWCWVWVWGPVVATAAAWPWVWYVAVPSGATVRWHPDNGDSDAKGWPVTPDGACTWSTADGRACAYPRPWNRTHWAVVPRLAWACAGGLRGGESAPHHGHLTVTPAAGTGPTVTYWYRAPGGGAACHATHVVDARTTWSVDRAVGVLWWAVCLPALGVYAVVTVHRWARARQRRQAAAAEDRARADAWAVVRHSTATGEGIWAGVDTAPAVGDP